MKFSALTKNIGRLGAGTAAALTLAVGMVLPASAMSTTVATQQHHSFQAGQVAELGSTSSDSGGWGWGWYPPFGFGGFGWGPPGGFNTDNSIHNCRTRMAPINNVGDGVVINNGNNSSC